MVEFEQRRFLGTWHIVASTFPMWARGDRLRPRFHYGEHGPGRLTDRVSFVRRGREKQILGIDTRLPGADVAYRWRGRGILSPLTSHWRVAHVDPEYTWAVITFSKSLFTPAGVDIIAREPVLSTQVMARVTELAGNPAGLFPVAQR